MKSLFVKKKVEQILSTKKGSIKLNLGCGTDYKKGWINVDNNSDNNIHKLDLNWDLRKPLPFPENSVDFIFNEHFMEHLSVEEGQKSVRDCLRVLKSGGVLRIATPDLALAVDKYLNLELKDDPVVKQYNMDFIKTKAERLNMAFSWWGHKWLYDWEELDRRLREAGATNVKQEKLRRSQHKDLNNLEIRDNSTLIAEVTK